MSINRVPTDMPQRTQGARPAHCTPGTVEYGLDAERRLNITIGYSINFTPGLQDHVAKGPGKMIKGWVIYSGDGPETPKQAFNRGISMHFSASVVSKL